jgi:hypothetical protein
MRIVDANILLHAVNTAADHHEASRRGNLTARQPSQLTHD